MSSILGLYTGKNPDMALIEKLNRILKLASDPDAYKWSIQVNSFIWKGITGIVVGDHVLPLTVDYLKMIEEEDCRRAGTALSKFAPDWIRYGSVDLMANDAASVMLHLRELVVQ